MEVGDGTTTVILLAGEQQRNSKSQINDGIHPQILIQGYRKAYHECIRKIHELERPIDTSNSENFYNTQVWCARTAQNSKIISIQRDVFAKMAVDAILDLDEKKDLKMIGVKRIMGGSITDSSLIHGVVFKKTFSYAGFEQQPKSFTNARVQCQNVELEQSRERANAQVRINTVQGYRDIVNEEWNIIYKKLGLIVRSGASIVLSRLPIGDLATQYFADRNIFCAGRVEESDLERVCAATGAIIQTSLQDLHENILGTVGSFIETQIGSERYNQFEKCEHAKTVTILLRGSSEQYMAEAERSLHDAIMIVKRVITNAAIVGGGGAIEMELSTHMRKYARTIHTKIQQVIEAFATSLEIIPKQLAENAGYNPMDILNILRERHNKGNKWCGINIQEGTVYDTVEQYIWEPSLMKINAISAATEAACLLLSVDETIKAPANENIDDRRIQGKPTAIA